MRKLWIGIIDRKPTKVTDKYYMLSQAQRASRKNSGTDEALTTYLQAVLEEAKRTEANLCFSSWDMKRAFDSVFKKALKLAYSRQGVEKQRREWITNFDAKRTTVVKTELAEQHYNKYGHEGFGEGEDNKKMAFCLKSGVGQGDFNSPSNWKAAFDILLRAIEISTIKGAFHVLESDTLHAQNAMAYVDDLISAVATKKKP